MATATPLPGPKIVDARAKVTRGNALIVKVSVELDEPGRVYVEYGNDEAGWYRYRPTSEMATEHVIHVVKLRPSTEYEYEIFVENEDGSLSDRAQGSFVTGELPEPLASLEFTVSGRPTSEIVILDVREVESDYMIGLDQGSEIVWYWLSTAFRGEERDSNDRGIRGLKQLPNFNLMFLDKNRGIIELDPTGNIVSLLPYGDETEAMHHDIFVLPDDRVIYISRETRIIDDTPNGGPEVMQVKGDTIHQWDMRTDQIEEVWNIFDFVSTDDRARWQISKRSGETPRVDWTHSNSLWTDESGNTLLSSRHLNQIISISPGYQSLEWRLGGPNSDFSFPDPNDKFYHQHQAIQLPNGNILLFDNGNTRPEEEGGEYSRSLELELDFDNMTATKVWEYRHGESLFASARSGTQRLENGNTVVAFGGPRLEPMVTVEADAEGNPVWTHTFWSPTTIDRHRAYPFPSLSGEIRIR